MATAVINKKDLPAIIARLESGHSLINESKGLGFTHNGPLRAALREHLGTEKYDVLMASKRPVARVGSTGRRATDRTPVARPIDDGLPVVESMKQSEGWAYRYVPEHAPVPKKVEIKDRGTLTVMDTGERIIIVTSPDGVDYTQSFDHEPAHLLRKNTLDPTGALCRFTRWDVSERRKLVEKGLGGAEELQKHIDAINARKGRKTITTLDMVNPIDAKLATAALAAGIMKVEPVKAKAKKGATIATTKGNVVAVQKHIDISKSKIAKPEKLDVRAFIAPKKKASKAKAVAKKAAPVKKAKTVAKKVQSKKAPVKKSAKRSK